MIVTKLEYQKRNPNRVNIYIDNNFFCGISINTLARELLYEGMNIDEQTLEKIVYKELEDRFLNRAIEYISRSAKTEFQVNRYLKDLKFKKRGIWYREDIQVDWDNMFLNIVNRLKELHLLDDEEYARMFVQSRLSNRPRGKNILISELLSKGVDREIAQRVCDEEVEDEYLVLKRVFEKKFKGNKFDRNDSRMVNFLLRKGFSWDLIEKLEYDTEEQK